MKLVVHEPTLGAQLAGSKEGCPAWKNLVPTVFKKLSKGDLWEKILTCEVVAAARAVVVVHVVISPICPLPT